VDLRAAEHLLVAQPPLTGLALFHAQQAVEKTLKAFLSWHDIPFRKTHDLSVLGQQCLAIDGTLENLCRRAARLTVFAWLFRYPGESEEPPLKEAQESLTLAREVYGAVLTRLQNQRGKAHG
jgi:HEPN domain-containing protein